MRFHRSAPRARALLSCARLDDRINPAAILDPSFSTDGLATLDYTFNDQINDVAVQLDGKIVAVGFDDGGNADFAIARFNVDGTLDTTFNDIVAPTGFNGDGRLSFTFGAGLFGGVERATSVAIDDLGRIVVAGFTDATTGVNDGSKSVAAFARFLPDGTFDPDFGTGGKATFQLPSADTDVINDIAIDADGKIVAVGYNDGGSADFAVLRLTSGGNLDATFNPADAVGGVADTPGIQTFSFTGAGFGGVEQASSVSIDADGKIVVAGFTDFTTGVNDGTKSVGAFARILADGTLDATFGVGGKATVNLPIAKTDFIEDVTHDADGKIVAVGHNDGGNPDFAMVRLNADGSLDATFNPADAVGGTVDPAGIQTFSFNPAGFGGDEKANAVAIQADGRIVVAGWTDFGTGVTDGSKSMFALARLNADGTLDATFDADGKATYVFGGDLQQANALAILPDGRFVLGGFTNVGDDFALAQVLGDTGDVSVVVDDNVAEVSVGDKVTYTITVTNAGPDALTGVQLADVFPASLLNVEFTSVAAGGATGNTAAGTGNLAEVLALPSGSSVVYTVTGTLSATAGPSIANTATVTTANVFDPDLTNNESTDTDPVVLDLTDRFAVGTDVGGSPQVGVYKGDGTLLYNLTPFDASFSGGVRVAMGDVNGDGVSDIVVGTGPGVVTSVRVLDGVTKAELLMIQPFEASFTGGVYVAVGDIDNDGFADIAITPDQGGGPRVRLFDGKDFSQINDFFGIEDTKFRGGARAAFGDIDADGNADLMVAAGFGGGPRLATFDADSLGAVPVKFYDDFFVFEDTLRNGVFVASGDLDGDGFAELIAGGGPGGGPRIYALDGADLLAGTQTVRANFFAGDVENRGGVRIGVADLDGDLRADLLAGDGSGAGSGLTAYAGSVVTPAGTPASLLAFDAFPGYNGGVFVG